MFPFANKRRQGNAAESAAASYLQRAGYRLVHRNYYTAAGELDLIVTDDEYLIFVEVKQRTVTAAQQPFGRPAFAVNSSKRRHILDSAREYIKKESTGGKAIRFDIVEILSAPDDPSFLHARIEHTQNAFGGNDA